ncbi:rod shape-determining protein MreD [Bailinhaonella thermotolerans]|uniref:Rod shape-determining protein MreD n=1 Tax=Bailinhaonella thermotolerans TaxID=1070861 RepID=A0A3A4AX41_9ACTN|nr:rod shape-determining protein MreD [Bailinhaonella thermotolerans]RJL34535.1 rod shape-determining protein MreD [Bailinhaonella thermotolerans]
MARGISTGLLVLVSLVVQVSVLNRLPLPGGIAADLLLVEVVAIGLCRGAFTGTVSGFVIGLVSDAAPPADHPLGYYALVFCVTGFLAGRSLERSGETSVALAMFCVAVGTMLFPIVGLMLGDERIAWGLVGRMLPLALLYNLLVCPLLVWLLGRVLGRRP